MKLTRPYIITGFVLHGWLFYLPGFVKLPDPDAKKWEAVMLPKWQVRLNYVGLELIRRMKGLFK